MGPHTYTVTALSTDGLSKTKSISYSVPGPPTATISSPAAGANYDVGESVPTAFSCAESAGGLGLTSCNDSNGANTTNGGNSFLDTTTAGFHTYTVTATSTDTRTGSTSINYSVGAPPTASISSPASGVTYHLGDLVSTTFSCSEAADGPGLDSCNDSTGANTTSGGNGVLDTHTAGAHTYTVTAHSKDGFEGTKSISYSVALPPVASITSPVPGRVYRLGQSVPTAFACTEGLGGSGLASCNDSNGTNTTSGGNGQLDTSTLGLRSYTVTAVSTDGLTHATKITYSVGAAPVATISSPASGGTYELNQVVPTTFSCRAGSAGLASCNDSNGANTPNGGNWHLDTSTVGAHTYTVSALGKDALEQSAAITYTVVAQSAAAVVKPAVLNFKVAPSSFRAAPSGAPTALVRRGRVGASVSYALTVPGKVTFSVKRRKGGRYVKAGSFTRNATKAGVVRFVFRGRVGRRTLAPGAYRLDARLKTAAGTQSAAVSKAFKIVR